MTNGSSEAPLASPSLHPLHRVFFGEDGLRAGWSLLLFFALLLLLGVAGRAIVQAIHPHPTHHAAQLTPGISILEELIPFVLLGVSTFIMARVERRPLRAFGIGATPRALPQFLAGLVWGLAFLSLLVGTLAATHLLVFDGLVLSGPSIVRFAAEWALGFLLVGLFEEYALRGYLQFTLARGLTGIVRALTRSPLASSRTRTIGFWLAAVILSFVFGFGHRTNAGESPLGLVSAGLIGLVFCLSLWRTGSLWWAIGFHAAWDWAQSFFYGVADSGHLVAFHLLASHPQGKPLFSGGTTGPEGSLYILPTILLIALAIVLTVRHTGWPAPGSDRRPELAAFPSNVPHVHDPGDV